MLLITILTIVVSGCLLLLQSCCVGWKARFQQRVLSSNNRLIHAYARQDPTLETFWRHNLALETFWRHYLALETFWRYDLALETYWRHDLALETFRNYDPSVAAVSGEGNLNKKYPVTN